MAPRARLLLPCLPDRKTPFSAEDSVP